MSEPSNDIARLQSGDLEPVPRLSEEGRRYVTEASAYVYELYRVAQLPHDEADAFILAASRLLKVWR